MKQHSMTFIQARSSVYRVPRPKSPVPKVLGITVAVSAVVVAVAVWWAGKI